MELSCVRLIATVSVLGFSLKIRQVAALVQELLSVSAGVFCKAKHQRRLGNQAGSFEMTWAQRLSLAAQPWQVKEPL